MRKELSWHAHLHDDHTSSAVSHSARVVNSVEWASKLS
jgi:hypothetical protein